MHLDTVATSQFVAPYHGWPEAPAIPSGHDLRHMRSGMLRITEAHVDEMQAFNRPAPGSETYARVDLIFVRQGAMEVFVRDRAIRVGTDEMMLLDYEVPFSFQTSEGTDCICVTIPKYWLRRQYPLFGEVTFKMLSGGQPFASSMRSFLSDWAMAKQDPCLLIGGQFGGLLALVLRNHGRNPAPQQSGLAERIIAAIREQCCDPELSADCVAASLGISKRYLYTVLAGTGTTFGKEIMAARLEASRNILANPGFDNLQIGEIAYLSGFLDQGHFSRRFRSRFGQSPRAFRETSKE